MTSKNFIKQEGFPVNQHGVVVFQSVESPAFRINLAIVLDDFSLAGQSVKDFISEGEYPVNQHGQAIFQSVTTPAHQINLSGVLEAFSVSGKSNLDHYPDSDFNYIIRNAVYPTLAGLYQQDQMSIPCKTRTQVEDRIVDNILSKIRGSKYVVAEKSSVSELKKYLNTVCFKSEEEQKMVMGLINDIEKGK